MRQDRGYPSMPEGPEMYRAARKINDEIGGRFMTEVWFAFDGLKRWQDVLTGKKFDRAALLYSASEIDVLEADELDDHSFISRAGLDILSSGAKPDKIVDWMRRDEFRRRRLGHLLLDQSFLAGVGNYLRSEILFGAGLPQDRRIADLGDEALERLAETAHTLMWRATDTSGITNDPERADRLKKAGWRRRDYRHYVFGRDGQACFACDEPIEKTIVGSRRLYFCPRCQDA